MAIDISKFRNIHPKQSCFIVGAGPSVAFENLSGINKHVVITVNSSIKLMSWKNKKDLRRRFWVSNDVLNKKWSWYSVDVLESYCTKVVRDSWLKHIDEREHDFNFFEVRDIVEENTEIKSNGKLCGVSSIPSAIDFSLWMGCNKIFLLGVDHKMIGQKSHFWHLLKKRPQRQGRKNHNPGIPHQIEIFKMNIPVFKALNHYAKKEGAQIYNCSKISTIEVFPRVSLHTAIRMS